MFEWCTHIQKSINRQNSFQFSHFFHPHHKQSWVLYHIFLYPIESQNGLQFLPFISLQQVPCEVDETERILTELWLAQDHSAGFMLRSWEMNPVLQVFQFICVWHSTVGGMIITCIIKWLYAFPQSLFSYGNSCTDWMHYAVKQFVMGNSDLAGHREQPLYLALDSG